MPIRVEVGTDIATIGMWDPTHTRPDFRNFRWTDLEAGLQSEAAAGRLFYITTGSDGGCLVDIYINDRPDADQLRLYIPVEREFLIISQSGQLLTGGVEDFIADSPRITSPNDHFQVPVGSYALTFYQQDHDKVTGALRALVGQSDYEYYESRTSPWGCLLFLAAAACLLFRLWYSAVCVLLVAIIVVWARSRSLATDDRFQNIARQVADHESRHPEWVFVLRLLDAPAEVEGGYCNIA